jgi:hypothetical protein
MKKTIAAVQSCYIPWKGYFDLINRADEFILYDDMQYNRRAWINRNRIKTPQGTHWLTIPVQVSGRFHQAIKDTQIAQADWNLRHWETIRRFYARAAHFNTYSAFLETLYLQCRETTISRVNEYFLREICALLNISTAISRSEEYCLADGQSERLVDLCRQKSAARYLTGPRAKNYLNEDLFREAGIEVEYMDYSGYPEYPQAHPPFDHAVSVIDLILNTGPEAPRYLKSFTAARGSV